MSGKVRRYAGISWTVTFALAITLITTSPVFASGNGTAEYVVKPGDTLTAVANRFEISLAQLLAANPQIKDPNGVRAGQVITLPAGRGEGLLKTGPKRLFFWEVEKNGGRVEKTDHLYYVHAGDNYYRIAKKYGLTFDDLVAANPQVPSPGFLRKGELIHIPIQRLGEDVYSFYETPPLP
jgi:LysM repeat protein